MDLIADNGKLILLATYNSKNPKTGPMVQTWILDKHEDPLSAYRNGNDDFVCGLCKRRSKKAGGDGSCYVQIGFAPRNIWYAYKKQGFKYSVPNLKGVGRHRHIRIGAYGEPTFFAFEIWDTYLSQASSWTGYTHQWKTCDQRFQKYLMASVDDVHEALEAQNNGWRTFRVTKKEHDSPNWRRFFNEARCPASKEAGNKIQCINCPSTIRCDGRGGSGSYNIVIKEH